MPSFFLHSQPSEYGFSIGSELYKKTTWLIPNSFVFILQYSTIPEHPKSKMKNKTKKIKIQVQYNFRSKELAEDWSGFSSGTFS